MPSAPINLVKKINDINLTNQRSTNSWITDVENSENEMKMLEQCDKYEEHQNPDTATVRWMDRQMDVIRRQQMD